MDTIFDNGYVKICTIDENITPLMANGQFIKVISKNDFQGEYYQRFDQLV
jgi:hypothetical protein